MKNKINLMILAGALITAGVFIMLLMFPSTTADQKIHDIYKQLDESCRRGDYFQVNNLELEAAGLIENHAVSKSATAVNICFGIAGKYIRANDNSKALIWLKRAIDHAPSSHESSLISPLLCLGLIYGEQHAYERSSIECLKARELIEKYRHKRNFPSYYPCAVLLQLGYNEDGLGNHEKAISFYRQGLEECRNIDHDETRYRMESNLLMLQGDSLRKEKNYASADKSYQAALRTSEMIQNEEYVARKCSQIYYRLALSSHLQGNTIKAKEYLASIPAPDSSDYDKHKLSEKISPLSQLL